MASTTTENKSSDSVGHVPVRDFTVQRNGEGNEKKRVVVRRGDITDFVGKAIANDGALTVDRKRICLFKTRFLKG